MPVTPWRSAATLAFATTVLVSIARADDGFPRSAEPSTESQPPVAWRGTWVGVFGMERAIADLTAFGGGVAFGIEPKSSAGGLVAQVRVGAGRTLGGLPTFEGAIDGGVDVAIVAGAFAGAGLGFVSFAFWRATDGRGQATFGPEGYLRVGYRFGRGAPVVILDIAAQLHAGGSDSLVTWVWGPTLGVGYAF